MKTSPKKPSRKAAAAQKAAPQPVPSIRELEERVRNRAYELYVERCREEGHEREDWTRAEAEGAAGHGPRKKRK
jgi:hypothetical protein